MTNPNSLINDFANRTQHLRGHPSSLDAQLGIGDPDGKKTLKLTDDILGVMMEMIFVLAAEVDRLHGIELDPATDYVSPYDR